MKFSEAWLREWVNPSWTTQELVAEITMAGLEVDAVEPVASDFSGVVVAEIISAEPHPDANKLPICHVACRQPEPVQVVCGANNARVGLKAAFAQVGAILKTDQGDDFPIKQAKLRGIESFGMLCGASELGASATSMVAAGAAASRSLPSPSFRIFAKRSLRKVTYS